MLCHLPAVDLHPADFLEVREPTLIGPGLRPMDEGNEGTVSLLYSTVACATHLLKISSASLSLQQCGIFYTGV